MRWETLHKLFFYCKINTIEKRFKMQQKLIFSHFSFQIALAIWFWYWESRRSKVLKVIFIKLTAPIIKQKINFIPLCSSLKQFAFNNINKDAIGKQVNKIQIIDSPIPICFALNVIMAFLQQTITFINWYSNDLYGWGEHMKVREILTP